MFRQAWQKTQQRSGFENAAAQRVGDEHVAAPGTVGQPGHAERRVGAQFQRIAISRRPAGAGSRARVEPADGFQPDAAVAHRQVATFDERETKVTREQRVLEIGFVVRARREQDGQRRAVASRREVHERIAQRCEETRHVLHAQFAKQRRETARYDEPVFERIPGTRRRLRAIGHHPPATVGRARKVCSVDMQMDAAGVSSCRRQAAESRCWPKINEGGIEPLLQQRLRCRRDRRARD